MKTLIITGIPATGKSTLAHKLSLFLGYEVFDLGNELKKAHILSEYDQKRRCYVVDEGLLLPFLQKVREKALKEGLKGLIIDSHLSHFLPKDQADLCIVTTCSDLPTLKKRLTSRKYSAAKIRENLDAEIFAVCLMEAREMGHQILTFDSKKTDAKAQDLFAKQVQKFLQKNSKNQ